MRIYRDNGKMETTVMGYRDNPGTILYVNSHSPKTGVLGTGAPQSSHLLSKKPSYLLVGCCSQKGLRSKDSLIQLQNRLELLSVMQESRP